VSLLGFLRRVRRLDAEVAVLGAGLPALAVSLELARRGRRVSVLVRGGGEESAASLGLVALGPGRPYTAVIDELGHETAREIWAAGRANLVLVREWLSESGVECGFEEKGTFLLAADRHEAEALADSEDQLRDDGFPGEFLDHYMLETHFDVSGFPGAYWAADGGELDATRLAPLLAAAARAAGAVFLPAPVRSLAVERSGVVVETAEGTLRAATAVVAPESGAAGLVPALTPRLRPAAEARLRVGVEEGALLPTTARTADGRIAWQAGPEHLRLASLGEARPDDPAVLEELSTRLPVLTPEAQRWTSRGDEGADGWPLVGALRGQPLAVACAFGPTSAGLAFAAARWVADALSTGNDPTPEPLRADREPRPPV
jgi:glycine/D-amino acid oxidase-like deaminating enzyme